MSVAQTLLIKDVQDTMGEEFIVDYWGQVCDDSNSGCSAHGEACSLGDAVHGLKNAIASDGIWGGNFEIYLIYLMLQVHIAIFNLARTKRRALACVLHCVPDAVADRVNCLGTLRVQLTSTKDGVGHYESLVLKGSKPQKGRLKEGSRAEKMAKDS